jgi:hypothetical protein
MPQVHIRVHLVVIPPTDPIVGDVSGLLEFGNDALHRPFGDTHFVGYLPQANIGILGDAPQDVGVVGEKGPAGSVHLSHHTFSKTGNSLQVIFMTATPES